MEGTAMSLNLCIIIANDKYSGSFSPLRGAEADGRALDQLLTTQFGWTTEKLLGFDAQSIRTTLRMLPNNYFFGLSGMTVNILIVCSLHGFSDGQGGHYLVVGNNEKIETQEFVSLIIPAVQSLQGAGNEYRVAFIFDCCRSAGDVSHSGERGLAAARNIEALVQDKEPNLPTVFWYACSDNQVSREAPLGDDDGQPYDPGDMSAVPASKICRGLFCLSIEREMLKIKAGENRSLLDLLVPVERATDALSQKTYGHQQLPHVPWHLLPE